MRNASAAINETAHRWLRVTVLASCALGCSSELGVADGEVGVSTAALSVCDETVPADRNIDGIPAYAQCTASNSAAIYSNDGVSTSTTKVGADWVRTQYSGGYQCTEFAHRYLYFRWDVDWVPNGNAGTWCDTQPPASVGVVQTTTPVHGDVMVLAPGSCGADATTGHVNLIDVVGSTGSLTAVEQNGARRGNYKATCGKCFLHVVANDGEAMDIPSTPGDPMGSAGSAAPPSAGSAAPPTAGSPALPTGMAGSTAPAPGATPPATTPPPAPAPAAPSTPMAGSAAPVPVTPAPAPVTAPVTAPAPAAPTSYMPPARSAAPEDPGCAVSGPNGSRYPTESLALIGLALAVLARRRRALR